MLCNRIAGNFVLCLTTGDFQFNEWKGFFRDLKSEILSPDREYDPELRQWYIKATLHNAEVIRRLAAKYFPKET